MKEIKKEQKKYNTYEKHFMSINGDINFSFRTLQVQVHEDDPDFYNTIKIPMTRPDSCTSIPGLTKIMCQKLPPTLKMCKNVKDYETYQNTVTHWWDASQLYGTDVNTNTRVRTGRDGKLVLNRDGRLPLDRITGLPITGRSIVIQTENIQFYT